MITSDSGSVDLGEGVGNTEALASLSINATSGTGSIEVDDLGTTTAAGVSGTTAIGNANTSSLTLTGEIYRYAPYGEQAWHTATGQAWLCARPAKRAVRGDPEVKYIGWMVKEQQQEEEEEEEEKKKMWEDEDEAEEIGNTGPERGGEDGQRGAEDSVSASR